MAIAVRRALLITARGKEAIEDHLDGGDRGCGDPATRRPAPAGLGDAVQEVPAVVSALAEPAGLARAGHDALLRGRPAAASVATVDSARAHVVQAELALQEGFDPAAVGALVTVELCGHWEHEGACRWPHHSAIDAERDPARFRTLFVADATEEPDVRERIERVLRGEAGWRTVSVSARPVAPAERTHADRLAAGPRRGPPGRSA